MRVRPSLEEAREESPPREEDSSVRKKRKTTDSEPASKPFTELPGMEKARRFDLAVKRFLTKADIEVCGALSEEEEVEALHSSWIDVSFSLTLFPFYSVV